MRFRRDDAWDRARDLVGDRELLSGLFGRCVFIFRVECVNLIRAISYYSSCCMIDDQ